MTDKQVKRFFEGYTKHRNAIVHPASEEIPTSPKKWELTEVHTLSSLVGGCAITTNEIVIAKKTVWPTEKKKQIATVYTDGIEGLWAFIPAVKLDDANSITIWYAMGPQGEDMPYPKGKIYEYIEEWTYRDDGTEESYHKGNPYEIRDIRSLGTVKELGTDIGFNCGRWVNLDGYTASVPLAAPFDKDAEAPAYDIWPQYTWVKKYYTLVDGLVKSCPSSDGTYINGINTNYYNRIVKSFDNSQTISMVDITGSPIECPVVGGNGAPRTYNDNTNVRVSAYSAQSIGSVKYSDYFNLGYERTGHTIKIKVVIMAKTKKSDAYSQNKISGSDPTEFIPVATGYRGLGICRIEVWEGYVE